MNTTTLAAGHSMSVLTGETGGQSRASWIIGAGKLPWDERNTMAQSLVAVKEKKLPSLNSRANQVMRKAGGKSPFDKKLSTFQVLNPRSF